MADFKITNAVNRLLKYVATLSCYFTFGPNLLTITADTLIQGDLTVEGNGTFQEDVTIDHQLTVGGPLYVSSNITANGDLDIGGNTNLMGNLHVDGNTALVGDLEVCGNIHAKQDVHVDGNTSLVGDLEVCGDAHFKQDVQIDGNLTVNGFITSADFVLFSPANRLTVSNQATYTPPQGQYFIAVTSMNQPLTIQFPSSPLTKQNFYIVADESGSASTYPITILPPIGGSISGSNQMMLQVSYANVWYYSLANTNTYYVLFTRP